MSVYMKRLFTIVVVALAASLTFAQAPLAKKAVSNNKLERMANVEELAKKAKETKEKYAVMAAKETTANEASTSVLRRGNSLRGGTLGSVEGKIINTFLPGSFRSEISAQPYKSNVRKTTTQDGNVTVTTDANGIITDVAGVEPKMYQRAATGSAYFNNGGSVNITNQSGMVTVVEDGNNVWIKDIITRYNVGSWVKGTKNGNTITVAARQPLSYSAQYSAATSLRWGVITAAGKIGNADDNAEAFTFTVNGDVMTLEGTQAFSGAADALFMGAYWDDDNSFTGCGDAETVLTYDPTYVAPSTELVTPPAGLEITGWYMNCSSVSSSGETPVKNQAINVAFAGNDVYVQGITTDFPTAWVKGTITGTSVKFDKFQYVGAYGGSVDCWFVGLELATLELIDATATYDAEAKTITFHEDVIINAAIDRLYYLNWFADAVISADAAVYEEPVITDLTASLPYVNTFETAEEQAQAAIYDANDDKSTFTFYKHPTANSTVARYRYGDAAADDYLVFPGLALKAGVTYKVSVDVASEGSSFPERMEVVAGKVAKASQLNIPVIASTVVDTKEFVTLANNSFTVAEDGTYYVAVHAISDADKYYLYVDNFSIKELSDAVPTTVSDLTVTADAQGANKATVTFTVPSKTIGGADITEDVKVVVKREGTEIFSETKAVGAAVTFEDEVEAAGYYTYSVEASYGENIGDAASEKVYIGYDVPNIVENVTIADKSGAIALAWDAPTDGANGYVVNTADFKYNVYPVEMMSFWGMTFPMPDYTNPYVSGVTETAANFEFDTNSGEHGFSYFDVVAENTTGQSDDVYAAIVTGAPYQMPVFESVAGGNLSYWWGYAMDSYNQQLSSSNLAGLYISDFASDGDGSCFLMAAGVGGWMNLQSGKIALAGAVNPTLTFDYAASAATPVTVSVITPKGETELTTVNASADYTSAVVSLADYKNEDWVRVIFTGTFAAAGDVYLDNIRVYNMLDNNLVAGNITAPSRVEAGDTVVVRVSYENQGSNAVEADAYTIDLYCNGTKVNSASGDALAQNEKSTVVFGMPTNVMTPSELVWKAEVVFDADDDKSNNITSTVKTVIKANSYPAVTNLAAEQTGSDVKLTWSEPDMTATQAEPVTDSFEDYESFAVNAAGSWSFIDVDGSDNYIIQDVEFPNGGLPAAYIVFDNSSDDFGESFAAHSGNKYMASFAAENGQNDDWMISPELDGNAQTISFWARTYTAQYGYESFEFYYSTTGKEISDFVKVDGDDAVPEEWTVYTYNVPAGAKYFAIRCTSPDRFIFLVDDVTYTPAGDIPADLAIIGYNIYRDSVKLNAEPVEEPAYTDATAAPGEHSYVVTVVYDKGESKVSNVVTIGVIDGIGSVAAKAAGVSADGRTIIVTGAEGNNVSVYTANGKTVYNGVGTAATRIDVNAGGVYIVKVGKTVVKAVVK